MMLEQERILDMWAAGRATNEIAASLALTPNSVRDIVSRARGRGDKRAVLRERGSPRMIDREAIVRLWEGGKRIVDISAAVGCSRHTVGNILSELRARGDKRAAYRHDTSKDWWARQAAARDMTRTELRRRVLGAIQRDDLLDAVLDDGGAQ